jgi:hypothetical protein
MGPNQVIIVDVPTLIFLFDQKVLLAKVLVTKSICLVTDMVFFNKCIVMNFLKLKGRTLFLFMIYLLTAKSSNYIMLNDRMIYDQHWSAPIFQRSLSYHIMQVVLATV